MLQKEFVPPQESSELKELGFNEPCLKFYVDGMLALVPDAENGDTNSKLNGYNPLYVSAPTFSQAFRFFREKYQIDSWIYPNLNGLYSVSIVRRGVGLGKVSEYQTYLEAELACLKKLIELAKARG